MTAKPLKKHKKRQFNFFMMILGIVLAFYSLSLVMPLIWGLFTSLKDKLEARYNVIGLPENWLFSNYSTVLKNFYVPVQHGLGTRKVFVLEMLWNSVFYAVGAALLQTLVEYIMAYVSARFKFKYGKIIYGIVIFALVFPTVGSNASALMIAETLHLKDSILGLWLMKSYFLGMYFLVFHSLLSSFPKDYADAAYIDGAGNLTVMFRIIFPMVRNTFFTIWLLLFIGYWNDYTTPMLFMENVPTLAYGLYYFNHLSRINEITNTPMRIAGCIMMMVPILVLFLFFHKRLIGNVSMGGLKE